MEAAYRFQIVVLTFYTDPQFLAQALPPGMPRSLTGEGSSLEKLTRPQAAEAMARVFAVRGNSFDSHNEDLENFRDYFVRIAHRLRQLH